MMTSSDSYVVLDGKVYRLEGSVSEGLSDAEFKREVLARLDGMEAGQNSIRADLETFKAETRTQFDALSTQITITQHDIAGLQTFVYWVLGAIGIFLASLAIPAFVQSWRSMFPNRESKTESVDLEATIRRVVRDMLPELKS